MTNRLRFSFFALLSTVLLTAIIPAASAGAQNTADKQLHALLATYETSLNAGDSSRIEQLYTLDGVFMPAGFPTASGRPAVRGAYDAVFRNIRITIHFTVDELRVNGDFAYARTHSAGTSTVVATGTSGLEANRELFIFARTARGWKIARYAFNKAS
ncbi:MAG TPA: SgcJ/EcaC family oxidoreductase [Gemmatimonadaceae bacterium]|nr:SgcJ/EcaC family oxidoreductase [Gemmatimonadaceae bacterium]